MVEALRLGVFPANALAHLEGCTGGGQGGGAFRSSLRYSPVCVSASRRRTVFFRRRGTLTTPPKSSNNAFAASKPIVRILLAPPRQSNLGGVITAQAMHAAAGRRGRRAQKPAGQRRRPGQGAELAELDEFLWGWSVLERLGGKGRCPCALVKVQVLFGGVEHAVPGAGLPVVLRQRVTVPGRQS